MTTQVASPSRFCPRYFYLALVLAGIIFPLRDCVAGHRGFRNSAIGGISIDAEGVVGPPSSDAHKLLLAYLRKEIKSPVGKLALPGELRMISLRAVEAACARALKDDFGRLPEEVQFLAGIQRLRYVFVYPERNDVVLAGPGEGWKIDAQGNVVGTTTGRPVLQLDDLLVALRSVANARRGGITVSIDPTSDGVRKLQSVLARQRDLPRVNRTELERAMKQAFGAQQVKLVGVPTTSHFARVLTAADYRMKRVAMALEASATKGLPSYLELIKGNRKIPSNVNPRWWMACDYKPLAASEDGLAWELRGPGVKVLTEDEFAANNGALRGAGRASSAAQRWADMMTAKYEALADAKPIFAELRNLMDMSVVAALLDRHELLGKAGCRLPLLMQNDSDLKPDVWNAPKTIPPEVSFLRTRNSLIVTASGGVEIDSWSVVGKVEVDSELAKLRGGANVNVQSLWWQ